VSVVIQYDGTFNGFLSAVFYIFKNNLSNTDVGFSSSMKPKTSLFGTAITVSCELEKAQRVWRYLKRVVKSSGASLIYKSFLSEADNIENLLLAIIYAIHKDGGAIIYNYGDAQISLMRKLVKSVNREKHRMEAFVRFKLTKDQIYFSRVAPDFNVLPLIANHFKKRYADQKWIIYDDCRKYGLYYDLNSVEVIEFEFKNDKNSSSAFTEDEAFFQQLWVNYFESTNIKSRINTKLHIRHVPKRYWKYLIEKGGEM